MLYTIIDCIQDQATVLAMSELKSGHSYFFLCASFSSDANEPSLQRKSLSIRCAPLLEH